MSFNPEVSNLAQLFKIPYDTWISIIYIFGKELHQPYSEICSMPFFEILMVYEKFKEDVENQNKEQESQYKDQQKMVGDMQSRYDPNNMKMPSMPQMPKMPDFSNMNFGNMGNLNFPNS